MLPNTSWLRCDPGSAGSNVRIRNEFHVVHPYVAIVYLPSLPEDNNNLLLLYFTHFLKRTQLTHKWTIPQQQPLPAAACQHGGARALSHGAHLNSKFMLSTTAADGWWLKSLWFSAPECSPAPVKCLIRVCFTVPFAFRALLSPPFPFHQFLFQL